MIFIRKNVLVICTGNSARSQMFEGLLNGLYSDKFEVYSAGTKPSQVNPYAIKAMKEIDINISHQRSKLLSEFYGQEFDIVVTVCDYAKKVCPIFPGAKRMIHHAFIDPADVQGSEKEILTVFRTVRNQINQWIKEYLLNELN